ncbi:hypothetical protein ACFTQ7_13750 [Lysinibacillus sp. NPDC056959]|uniref:hypothetical protein n=1 Tax=Lysinibacillus sp. NPDC056959 TaxID=3345981 RepID=UPI0036290756
MYQWQDNLGDKHEKIDVCHKSGSSDAPRKLCAKAKRQRQMFSVAKAKRQQQMFSVAKAKRQQQMF